MQSTRKMFCNIGFPGQIRMFISQIYFLCIQIRRFWHYGVNLLFLIHFASFQINVFIILKYTLFIPNHENVTIFAIWSFNLDALTCGREFDARKVFFKLNDINTDSFDIKVKSNKRMNLNGNFHGTT